MKREAWRQYYQAAFSSAYSASWRQTLPYDEARRERFGAALLEVAHTLACEAAERALNEEQSRFGEDGSRVDDELSPELRADIEQELIRFGKGAYRLAELLWPADAQPPERLDTDEVFRLLAERVETLQAELAETKHVLEQERDEVATFRALAEQRQERLSLVRDAVRACVVDAQPALRDMQDVAQRQVGHDS